MWFKWLKLAKRRNFARQTKSAAVAARIGRAGFYF